MANLRRLDQYGDDEEGGGYNFTDPNVRVDGPQIEPGGVGAPKPPVDTTAPPPPQSNVHSEWFGGGPQGQYSRGLEDAFLNYAGSASDKSAAGLAAGFGNGAKAVGNDKIDFGFGPVDVLKDVGGANTPWFGDYADPNHISPNSGGGPGGGSGGGMNQWGAPNGSPTSYRPPASGSGVQLQSFMGQEAPQQDRKNFDDVMASLKQLFPNGAYNQDVVNRRSENARENLLRQRKSTDANDRAILADRGTLGSGPEITALTRADQNMADQYQNATSGIYADESNNADQRMMQALQTAAGMTSDDASQLINAYLAQTGRGLGVGNLGIQQGNLDVNRQRANNDFTLGSGNLALGNINAANGYNLGLANYGLGRDRLLLDQSNTDIDRWLKLIEQGYKGADQSASGYRGKQ